MSNTSKKSNGKSPAGANSKASTATPKATKGKKAQAKRASSARSASPTIKAPVTRKAALLALLRRPGGAALAELVNESGWQIHSIRAALTHFRLAGLTVTRQRDETGTSRYSVTAA